MDFAELFESIPLSGIEVPATMSGGDFCFEGMMNGKMSMTEMVMAGVAEGMKTMQEQQQMETQSQAQSGMEDVGQIGDDLSNFFNFDTTQEAPVDESAQLGNAQLEQLLASAASTLLSSFDPTPALLPSSTLTASYSDFDDDTSPEMRAIGSMFPQLQRQNSQPQPAQPSSSFNVFGAEPAFDDVDSMTVGEHGLFGLPLFGGIPSAQNQSQEQARQLVMRIQNKQQPAATAATASEPKTASPREVFLPAPGVPSYLRKDSGSTAASRSPMLPPASPLVEVEEGDFSREPESGRAKKDAKDGKKRKPYGSRRTSRPMVDADAPTLVKSYAAPGATTRKLIPAGFQKKLKLASDEMGDATLPGTMKEDEAQELMEEIDEKRRRNCVAARESRRRKVEYLTGLKDEIRGWRSFEEQMREKLRAAGMEDLLDGMTVPGAMDLDE